MEITISELRKMTEQMLDHLESTGQSAIEIEADFYWTIEKEDLYNPYEKPQKVGLAQLYDDYESLKKISDHKTEPVGYALVWLASIFRYVGEKCPF